MSLSILKGALAVVAACGVAAGVTPLGEHFGKPRPYPAHAALSQRPPATDKALKALLDQYSKAYTDCKSVRRRLAGISASPPPRFAASQRDLLAKRESSCRQSAPGKSAQDLEESKLDADLGRQRLQLATQRQRWQDSLKTQTDKQLAASTTALDRATIALRQALAAKRKGYTFRLHGVIYQAYVADLNDDKVEFHLDQDSTQHSKFTSLEELHDFYKQRGQSPAMLTNAGMFHANQEPVGLLIANGAVIHPLNVLQPTTDENFYMRPNGVFFVDAQNIGRIDSTDGYQRQWVAGGREREVQEATQSGPMLVINNRLNGHFSELSTNAKVRSGVGIVNPTGNAGGRVVFLTTDGESTFYDFATTFRDLFACSNALFLDGAISKMYLAGEQTNYTGGFFGPMVSVIGRTSKPKPGSMAPAKLSPGAKQAAVLPGPPPTKAAPARDSATSSSANKPASTKMAPSSPAPAMEQGPRRPNAKKGHE